MIGLYKAVCDYQFDKQASFRAFAELCITRQIITAIKSATRKKHIPLNTYISLNRSVYEGDTERPLIDVLSSTQISDPEEVLIGRESYEAVADSIEHSLSKLERGALDLYLMGYSYQQIADALQKSTKCVDNAIQRVKKKLEEYLKNAG
jgi:RNA polymerase sporulation-specific sigma factor